jgi:hypothetical protein
MAHQLRYDNWVRECIDAKEMDEHAQGIFLTAGDITVSFVPAACRVSLIEPVFI